MSSTPCKSLKKDGTPCRGNGLDQLDGYCIAHAPADKAWEWRSRGGKASSAAARADKRIPERLRHAIDKVSTGMDQVLEGKLEPAALSAISRAAKVLIELYRLADHEMDLIRSRGDRRRRRPGRRCRWRPRTPRRCRRYRRLARPVPDRRPHRPGPCRARTCRNERRRPTTGPRPDRRRQTALRLPATDQVHKEGYRRLQRTGDRQPF